MYVANYELSDAKKVVTPNRNKKKRSFSLSKSLSFRLDKTLTITIYYDFVNYVKTKSCLFLFFIISQFWAYIAKKTTTMKKVKRFNESRGIERELKLFNSFYIFVQIKSELSSSWV